MNRLTWSRRRRNYHPNRTGWRRRSVLLKDVSEDRKVLYSLAYIEVQLVCICKVHSRLSFEEYRAGRLRRLK